MEPDKIIITSRARCRDCYRCLRVCPVKAIRMKGGQACVDDARCVLCGTCVRECPQKAKSIRNDTERAAAFIKDGFYTAVSLAPSFAAVYSGWRLKRIISALRRLGFNYIAETAIGAKITAELTAGLISGEYNKTIICSACPAVVNYIEKYRHETITALAPVVSPMIAHAKIITAELCKNKKREDIKMVFIGPCAAKKKEAEREEVKGLVDAVLTFDELNEWLARENINLNECDESDFDEPSPDKARLFPLEGGLIRTASLKTDMLDSEILAISGFDEIKNSLDSLSTDAGLNSKIKIIEPLFCVKGCINGPGAVLTDKTDIFGRKNSVIEYCASSAGKKSKVKINPADFSAGYNRFKFEETRDISDEEIKSVLEKTGKMNIEDELNCGACGYNSCRDKAVAVIRGMAELEMCMPYMRKMAERRTDKIIETSPNGIIILDEKLHIISMNDAFKKMFMCTEVIIGKKISYLIDPANFEKLAAGEGSNAGISAGGKKYDDKNANSGVEGDKIEVIEKYPSYNIICHEILYTLPGEKQYVGIFVNITNLEVNQKRLDEIKTQTVRQASELLEHQIDMAQRMAKFLGEYTARGEELVKNLMKVSGPEAAAPENAADKTIDFKDVIRKGGIKN